MESSVLVCGLIFNLLADAQLSEIAFTWTEVKLYFFWLVPPSADTSSLPWKDKTMFSCLGFGPVFDLYII